MRISVRKKCAERADNDPENDIETSGSSRKKALGHRYIDIPELFLYISQGFSRSLSKGG